MKYYNHIYNYMRIILCVIEIMCSNFTSGTQILSQHVPLASSFHPAASQSE